MTRRAGQPHLNADQIKKMKVIKPPHKLINDFARYFHKLSSVKKHIEMNLLKLDTLFNSLLQRAFKDELKFNDKAFKEMEQTLT